MNKDEKYRIIVSGLLIAILLVFNLGIRVGISWTGNSNSITPGFVEGFQGNFTDIFLNDVDKSDILEYPEATASYIIFKDGTDVCAKNGETGQIDYGGSWDAGGVDGAIAVAVIQAVIDALPDSIGGLVFVKGEDYTLTDTIVLKKLVALVGENTRSTRFTLANNVNKDMISFGQTTHGSSFIYIGYLHLLGNKANQASGNGIHLYNNGNTVMDVKIESVYINSVKEHGIYTENTWGIRVVDSLSESNDGNGFFFKNPTEDYYVNLYAASNGGCGFQIQSGNRARMVNCRADGNNIGFQFEQVPEGAFTNLITYSPASYGFYVRGSTDLTFTNCQVSGNNVTLDGVHISSATGPIVNENIQFIGCSILDCVNYPYRIYADQEDTQIIGGRVNNVATISDLGIRTEIHYVKGYITENCGTQICADNENIAHGLAGIPTFVSVTPMNDTYNSVPVIATVDWSGVDATNIQVGLYMINGTAITDDTILVAWRAEYEP